MKRLALQPAPHKNEQKKKQKKCVAVSVSPSTPPTHHDTTNDTAVFVVDPVITTMTSGTMFQHDVLSYMHTNLVQIGVINPRDLVTWHSLRRAYYNDWCREEYIVHLCTEAAEMNSRLYPIYHFQAKYYADAIRLPVLARAVTLGEWLFRSLVPTTTPTDTFTIDHTILSSTYRPCSDDGHDISIGEAFNTIGFEHYDGEDELSMMQWILAHVMRYLPQRHGWDVVLDRGDDEQQLITKAHKAHWDDVIYLRIAKCVIR